MKLKKDLIDKYKHFFRAMVIDNVDPEDYGRVKVWIPDLMPEVTQKEGLWAYMITPAGGRNYSNKTTYSYGSTYIPPKGAWVYVFFEKGDPSRPVIIGTINLKNSKVLIENQVGIHKEAKWVPFKSPKGRSVIFSDDPWDSGVRITGKKRLDDGSDPAGDPKQVLKIKMNQMILWIDERWGKERILIADYKGNFLEIDTIREHLNVKTNGNVHIYANSSVSINANKNIHINSTGVLNISVNSNIGISLKGTDMSVNTLNLKLAGNLSVLGNVDVNGYIKCNNVCRATDFEEFLRPANPLPSDPITTKTIEPVFEEYYENSRIKKYGNPIIYELGEMKVSK